MAGSSLQRSTRASTGMFTVCTPAASNAARSFLTSAGSVEGKCESSGSIPCTPNWDGIDRANWARSIPVFLGSRSRLPGAMIDSRKGYGCHRNARSRVHGKDSVGTVRLSGEGSTGGAKQCRLHETAACEVLHPRRGSAAVSKGPNSNKRRLSSAFPKILSRITQHKKDLQSYYWTSPTTKPDLKLNLNLS